MSVEALTAAPQQPAKRGPGRPFVKGQSGNPGGRKKSLAGLVQAQTKSGKELVEFMVGVFRGECKDLPGHVPLAARMEAATWLRDTGFGRPAQVHQVQGADGGPLVIERRTVVLAVLPGER